MGRFEKRFTYQRLNFDMWVTPLLMRDSPNIPPPQIKPNGYKPGMYPALKTCMKPTKQNLLKASREAAIEEIPRSEKLLKLSQDIKTPILTLKLAQDYLVFLSNTEILAPDEIKNCLGILDGTLERLTIIRNQIDQLNL
jgi:hypothetical protein